MGRPIKQKYFLRGGVTPSDSSFSEGWYGLSGTVSAAGLHYPVGTTITIPQGQLGAESVTATANLTINPTTGAISGITMTNYGSGYNSTVTSVTINKPASVIYTGDTSGVTARNTFTVASTAGIAIGMLIAGASTGFTGYVSAINGNTITSTENNNGSWTSATNLTFTSSGTGATFYFTGVTPADAGAIAATAWITGDSQARTAAIVKQEASHRYLVEAKTNGSLFLGQCKLISTSTYAAGQMTITALDTNGSSYFVTKLTARKARIVQYVKSGSFVFASGVIVGWNLTAASATAVKIVTNAV